MNGLHLVMPMGGKGLRFFNNGFERPKPLINLRGKPFFYWAIQSVRNFVDLDGLTAVVLKDHVEKYGIDREILHYFPEANIVAIPESPNGALLTCLQGINDIPDDVHIIFNDCDHAFKCSRFYEFCMNRESTFIDGALLTFTSSDPKFSYAELNTDRNVVRTVEKQVISDMAICGAYYFNDKEIFSTYASHYLKTCHYSEYYISGVYNSMIQYGCIVKTFPLDFHLSFGTPSEFKEAEEFDRFDLLL